MVAIINDLSFWLHQLGRDAENSNEDQNPKFKWQDARHSWSCVSGAWIKVTIVSHMHVCVRHLLLLLLMLLLLLLLFQITFNLMILEAPNLGLHVLVIIIIIIISVSIVIKCLRVSVLRNINKAVRESASIGKLKLISLLLYAFAERATLWPLWLTNAQQNKSSPVRTRVAKHVRSHTQNLFKPSWANVN